MTRWNKWFGGRLIMLYVSWLDILKVFLIGNVFSLSIVILILTGDIKIEKK